jgi:ElaB/YqjD/DUF883 family membrane-anchored ribosome-binding protein
MIKPDIKSMIKSTNNPMTKLVSVKKKVRNQVRYQVYDQLDQVYDQLEQVRNQVRYQVYDQLEQVRNQVEDQVRDKVYEQVWVQSND